MAAVVMMMVRRRQQLEDAAAFTVEERAAITLQAAFRGMKYRQAAPGGGTSGSTFRKPAPGGKTTVVMIPVRQAARVLREGRDRRAGCIRLLLYIVYMWIVAFLILSVGDRSHAYQLREAVVHRLASIETEHEKNYEHLGTLDDVAEWIPTAATRLRNDPHAWEDVTSADEAREQGYIPSYGLFNLYNRPIPTLLVTMRRRQTAWDGCDTKIGGAGDWIRPCWGDTEDTASWEGPHSGRMYHWDPAEKSFVVRFSLGYPPVPQETELEMWDSKVLDGFLSDRTLDVTVTLVLANGNNNLLCSAKIRWDVRSTGLIEPHLEVVSIPTTFVPQETGWMVYVTWLDRSLVVALTVVHVAQLVQDIRTRNALIYGPDGMRIASAVVHIGSITMIFLTLCGVLAGKLGGDLELPDISLLGNGTSMTSNEAEIADFLHTIKLKVAISQWVDRLMGFTWMLATAKLVKMLEFDPRLSLSSRTVAHAGTELGYFMLSCALTVFGYAISGSVMFGSDTYAFKDKILAVISLFGGLDGDIEAVAEVKTHGAMALLYYWTFAVVVMVLFLNIAVAILVDAYVEVREADKQRVKQEQILAHPSLRKLVAELELSKPSMVCTQLPCKGPCKAFKRRNQQHRTHPAGPSSPPPERGSSRGQSKYADTALGNGFDDEQAARAPIASRGSLTGLLGSSKKVNKYWVQPWATSKAFGVDELANALELIGETKTAAQGGIGMAREHWKVARKQNTGANIAKAFFKSIGVAVLDDSARKSMSNTSSVSDLADAVEEEAKRQNQEIYVDFYTVSLRLAKIGAPGHLARLVADVFGKRRTRRKRLGSRAGSESSWGGSSRPSSQASGDSLQQPHKMAFGDIAEDTAGEGGPHVELLEKLAEQQESQAVQMVKIEAMLEKLCSGTYIGGI